MRSTHPCHRSIALLALVAWAAAVGSAAVPGSGAISGRVLDERGEPIAGLTVMASAPERVMGKDRLIVSSGKAVSDSTGRYRLESLRHDTYFVFVCPPPFCAALSPGTRAAGREVTFHPAATELAAATAVKVTEGVEFAGVDIALRVLPTHDLFGTLSDEQGHPLPDASLLLFPGDDLVVAVAPVEAVTSANGEFWFRGLTSGSYLLKTFQAGSADAPELASSVIELHDDVLDWSVQTRRGITAKGEILFERGTPDFEPRQLKLAARPGDFVQGSIGPWGGASVVVHDDWTFEIRNAWGPQKLEIIELPPRWMLKAIEAGGVDHTDAAIDLESLASRSGTLRTVFTRRLSGVSGQVRNERDEPVPGAEVLAFSTDPERWELPSRFVRRTKADEHGRYVLSRVPPGDYHLVALDVLPDHRASRIDVLEMLAPIAIPVTVNEGEQKRATLKLQPFAK